MPAIRDYSQGYAAAVSDNQIAPTPDYRQNDLLVALVSCDTYAANERWFGGEVMANWFQDSAGVFTDYSAAAASETTADCFTTRAAPAANDACYFGNATRFNGLAILVSTAGAGTQTWVWEYYNGAAWATLTTLSNRITLTSAAGPRSLTFNCPTDWTATTINGVNQYWIRMRISAFTSQTTRPIYSQGWIGTFQQIFSITSGTTAGCSILYKVAGATETASGYEFTEDAATLDTKNCAVISVRDVDTAVPFATSTTDSYAVANQDSSQALDNTTTAIAQSFTSEANITCLATVSFYLKKTGSPTGDATAKLYTHSGVKGTSSVPTGTALAVSNVLDVTTLTTSYQTITFTFPWYYQYQFTASTNYCIVLEYTTGDASNYVQVGYDASAAGHAGNKATFAAAVWTAQATDDVCFDVSRFAYTTATQTTMRWNMPTMTTRRDNSLVLWQAGQAAVSVPMIIEGACTFLAGKDGAAHSDCWSWGWQKTAGTTPTVAFSCNTTGAQVIAAAVCAINPPSSGATIIPAYCSNDASLYISPCTGAAFDGDSAPAATVTSVFSSSLNGAPLRTGSATVTLADTGINTYLAQAAYTTTVLKDTAWYGIRNTIASRNLAAKNILFHIQPATPIAIQTTDSVALPTACGVAIGLASTANTHYKVYHVGGANSSFGIQRHQPVIINTDYTGSGMIGNTGTLVPTAVVELGFMVSGKTVATSWTAASIWRLDTTTVAGGNSTEPIDIPGIVRAVSNGHVRRSIIQEGATQVLILQPVQIGDGGTNPVYLLLDGTAVEFPQQYNKSSKNVAYCSVDNVCSLLYYPGASDTIIHRNSVISSASRYKWGLHASAHPSASYDFSGLLVQGAGIITLNKSTSFSELTINDFSSLDVSNATLNSCVIKKPSSGKDAMVIVSGTVSGSTINAATVAAGNWLCSVTNPGVFYNTTFVGGGGHAVRLTATGSYTLVSDTWTSFGADESTGAAIYNNSSGSVTLTIVGGTIPTVRNGTSSTTTIITNPVDTTITVVDITTGSPVTSARVLVTAAAGGPLPYQLSSTLTRSGATVTATCTAHGLSTGKKALIKGADQTEYNGVYVVTVTGNDTFTYTISGTPVSPATGTITTTGVVIDGTTDGSGVITDNRSFTSSQPITGRVRRATSGTLYKTGTIAGTISSTAGFASTIQMIPDQ